MLPVSFNVGFVSIMFLVCSHVTFSLLPVVLPLCLRVASLSLNVSLSLSEQPRTDIDRKAVRQEGRKTDRKGRKTAQKTEGRAGRQTDRKAGRQKKTEGKEGRPGRQKARQAGRQARDKKRKKVIYIYVLFLLLGLGGGARLILYSAI